MLLKGERDIGPGDPVIPREFLAANSCSNAFDGLPTSIDAPTRNVERSGRPVPIRRSIEPPIVACGSVGQIGQVGLMFPFLFGYARKPGTDNGALEGLA